jgi:hypothetical protein
MLLAIALFAATFGIREFTRTSLGAGFVPRLTASILFLLGLILLVRGVKQRRSPMAANPSPEAAPTPEAIEGLAGPLPVLLNILLFFIYLLCLEPIGFMLTTPFYVFCQILLLSNPKKIACFRFAGIAVALTAASFYLFTRFFQVLLPNGWLE